MEGESLTLPIFVCSPLQLESIPLLTKDEEFELGVAAQRWLPIERIRKDFEDEFARQPTAEVSVPPITPYSLLPLAHGLHTLILLLPILLFPLSLPRNGRSGRT